MRKRSLLVALLAMLAVSVAYPAQSGAATSANAKSERLLVSPRAGTVVRSHHAWLRVRSRTLTDTLRVRLNGAQIGDDFGVPRRGIRTLRASLSHGLRRGRNVLRVTVRSRRGKIRKARARFVVRTRRHLVGAGQDRELAVDGNVRVRGAVRARPRGDVGAKLRWRLVRAPRRSPAHDALLGGAAPHVLSSPGGRSAGFRPRVPGRYKLRLSAGGGSRAASDTVTFEVTARSRLVPIDTMPAMDAGRGDQRGIRVGDMTFRLRDARGFASVETSVLQVLVLERTTLGLVSNSVHADVDGLKAELEELDGSNLVIVVAQPTVCCQAFNFDGVLEHIGVADTGAELLAGELSAIGVPGIEPGGGDVNATRKKGEPVSGAVFVRPAPMKGYLTPDQWGNFGFVPKERVPFSFAPKPPSSCTPASNGGRACIESVGLRIRHLGAHTGAPAAHDGQFYAMHFAGTPNQLAGDLEAMPAGDVVMIEAVSNRPAGQGYFPPIAAHDRAAMVRLANAIADVGGTRNAFNRIARQPGSDKNGGMTYALVGWKGAGEGAGAEVAAGVDGAGDAPSLSGVVRPDRQSQFRPVEGDSTPDALTELVMEEPTAEWPLDAEPGPKAALKWLGSTNNKISSDPRADYRTQRFGEAEWDAVAADIEKVAYTAVPADRRDEFTEAEFLKGRAQLVKELRWVGNVRSYLANLAGPVSDGQALSYATVQDIGARVHKEAEPPDDEATMRWLEFAEIMLELAGPITHEVSSTVASVMALGTWMFGADEKGGPVEELPFKASEFGKELVAQMALSVAMYKRMGDVIVSDPKKLAFVGQNGGCSANSDTCPRGWSFSDDDLTRLQSDLRRTVERAAYEELLPLGFTVYGLNPQRLDRAPDPRWYNCNLYPFWYYTPTAVAHATTPLLWELDPHDAGQDLWKLLVLARPGGSDKFFHAQPPSDDTLKRVFGPISPTSSPDEGGLAISLARLLPADGWSFWAPAPRFRPTHDACG